MGELEDIDQQPEGTKTGESMKKEGDAAKADETPEVAAAEKS
jgi:hypothetical protein